MPSSTDSTPGVALSVAGSDSGGGAGIQADLKALARVGVHGTTALTALTAQNSRGVRDVHPVPPDFVEAQIEAVTEDFTVRAAKTGMLHNRGIIEVVARHAGETLDPLVVDPVMVAEAGDPLLESAAETTLVDQLLPEARLTTPNLWEARRIAGQLDVDDTLEPPELAPALARALGGPFVLITGGHREGEEAVDCLSDPAGELLSYGAPRLDTRNTHGAGCVFSSLITGWIARGRSVPRAVEAAKPILTEALRAGYAPGGGDGTLNLLTSGDTP